ncbi:MAG: carboxynorspermidine decarboxylase, partial [Candidatus Margulisiibacteriota bacterium]
PLISPYLDGVACSSVNEARLGEDYFGKESHVYSPAYSEAEMPAIVAHADHMTFNSFSQWEKFRPIIKGLGKPVHCGIRLNPEIAEVGHALYNPCMPYSRFGVTATAFRADLLDGISGFHMHTLCGKGAEALARTVDVLLEKFGRYFGKISWLNLGGGHTLTQDSYNVELLVKTINKIRRRFPHLTIYLEPGEAVVYDAGYLVTTVLDIIHNGMDIAIIDSSATAHMPDVLEMPYKPHIIGASEASVHPYQYRIGGVTCLSGDIVGDYSFPDPLKVGQRLIFTDMAQYTVVKNTTFNGIPLPAIARLKADDTVEVVRTFGYDDFRTRLS